MSSILNPAAPPHTLTDADVLRIDLLDLMDETRRLATTARRYRSTRVLRYARSNWFALDAAVNILYTLGVEYVQTALAVLDAGRTQLIVLSDELAEQQERAHINIRERVA